MREQAYLRDLWFRFNAHIGCSSQLLRKFYAPLGKNTNRRLKNIRTQKQFLIALSVLFVWSASFSSLFAQEKLQEIVRRITPSVVMIFSYDEQGNIVS